MSSTLWDRTLAELRGALPSQEFAAWIESLRTSADTSETLIVEAPTLFHRNWVQRHFLERIRTTVASVAGRPVSVSLAVGAEDVQPRLTPAPVAARTATPAPGTGAQTFATFVVGACNALAHAAARAVVANAGHHYNPLFIHGGVGLGKTHLINAIAHALRADFRSSKILAISAERFVNEMVGAVRRQQMESFHQRFRRVDTLLVDDVQFVAGKERTQEELLHTFDLLCGAGKQIVVSSDKAPRAIPNLEAGLRSRFEGGLIAEVTRPDRATRRAILERKATDLAMPPAVLDLLAERIHSVSVRELEGALTRIRAVAALTERAIDLALAQEVVDLLYPLEQHRVSAERIETLVGAEMRIDHRYLASPSRNGRLVLARQVAMYLMRKFMGVSLAEIGGRYGRDHTTVLHAVRVIETRRTCDPEVRRLVSALEERL